MQTFENFTFQITKNQDINAIVLELCDDDLGKELLREQ